MNDTAPNTPSGKQSAGGANHRLLYRGALALPDSYLLLDGLTFVMAPSGHIMDNPLAMSLGSMRGVPSLQLLGTEDLKDVWLDTTNDISVYIHAYSVLSQTYFENILCQDPITSPDKRTSVGIRCGLGDGSDPATDFLIYGQLVPDSNHDNTTPSTSKSPPLILHMFASRILTAPPIQPVARAPRPDDPNPRKPPVLTSNAPKRKRETSTPSFDLAGNSKRSKAALEEQQLAKARDVMLNMPKAGAGASAGLKRAQSTKTLDTFKVPVVPSRAASLDVIGDGSSAGVFASIEENGKGRAREIPGQSGSNELEKANKTVIKQATIGCLAKYGIGKAHGDFTDLYQGIYRGVCLAMRNIMRTQAVTMRTVDRIVQDHSRMYVKGTGEYHPK